MKPWLLKRQDSAQTCITYIVVITLQLTMMIRRLVLLLACAALAAAQESTVDWKVSLAGLEQQLPGASDAWRAEAEALRSSIAAFAAEHPQYEIHVPDALVSGASGDALKTQLDALTAAVNDVIRQSPGTPFNLGVVSVTVTGNSAETSPVTAGIDQTEIRDLDLLNVAKALDELPGVSIQHISANRNEAGIMVRGFSTRGQVPLYVDGIPISVPYDGYVDFNRFLTSDIAEIQVSRGYSSPLMGPDALGGSINLVTEDPVNKYNADALIGTGSGNMLLSSLRLGTRLRHVFAQSSIDWLQDDYIPLSGNFVVHQYPGIPDIVMTDRLNHSGTRDERYTGRLGWTPKGADEYVLSYINLKGQKGAPLYQGPNTAAAFRNFWTWPYWDMDNYYLHSNTQLGENSSIKARVFYSQFRNSIDFYSTDTYTVMNTKSAEHSFYDEHNDGFSTEFETHAVKKNTIGASFFLKNDVHKEFGVYPGISPFPLTEPFLHDIDRQTAIGLQDVIHVTSRLSATAGFSADHFDGIQGQQYNAAMTGLLPFTCIASPSNTSYSGCTAHVWNYNPQVSLSYAVSQAGNFFLTFSDRGRFPMLKDIYSAGLGAGLPNPNLLPEHSRNWNLGYAQAIGTKTVVRAVLFRSDLRNAIESVYVTDPGGTSPLTEYCPNSKIIGFCNEMANIGSEVHEGLELEVRTTPIQRLTLNAAYSFLNRDISYDFGNLPNVSQVNTSISILPTLPRNKFTGVAALRLPHQVMAIANLMYEGGLTLQDTTYAATSPLFLPFAESFATLDLGVVAPIRSGITLQAGIKNVLDRNYAFTAGYPEEGRNWYANLRYRF
jgi:iron complex outermembrane receptor protein